MAEEFIEDIINNTKAPVVEEDLINSSSVETPPQEEKPSSSTETVEDFPKEELTEVNSASDSSSKQTIKADADQPDTNLSVEELASQLGWRADHQGEDAVDAATYILRSKDIQKSMSKHNKDLKDQLNALNGSVEALKQHNEKVYQADVKKLQSEIVALKKERKAAIELADVDKVEELDEQIAERQKDIDSPKEDKSSKAADSPNPVFDTWVKDNQWYLEDQEMANYADVVAEQFVGAPLERIYTLVRNKVKEVFPEKFEVKQTPSESTPVKEKPVGPQSPVEKGANNKVVQQGFSKADLSPEQVNIMNQFVRGGIMTEEQYINDISKLQG